MADRVGVISKGELILVEDKVTLMNKMGRKELTLQLQDPLADIPPSLADWNLELKDDGNALLYAFDSNAERTGVPSLLRAVTDAGLSFKDLSTTQSSLEDIFVGLVHEDRPAAAVEAR